MQNTKTKRILVIALVVISLFILATQSYATGVGGVGGVGGSMSDSGSAVNDGMTGDYTGDANSYGTDGNGIVGDSSAARDGTLGDESAMDSTTGYTMNEDGGTSWMSVIVAIVIAVALVAVVIALIPKKKID